MATLATTSSLTRRPFFWIWWEMASRDSPKVEFELGCRSQHARLPQQLTVAELHKHANLYTSLAIRGAHERNLYGTASSFAQPTQLFQRVICPHAPVNETDSGSPESSDARSALAACDSFQL